MLALFATGYGIAAAAAVLLQARQMLERRRSCDVSAGFLAVYSVAYGVWLIYGLSIGDVPLILVDAVGLVSAATTLGVALWLRGPLHRPATWASCPAA